MFIDTDGETRRADLLLEMYRQTSMHLGRHVSGVWQCVGVVGAGTVALTVDLNHDRLADFFCALAIILCGWLTATTLDASNWFNRNLTIVGNIERYFLRRDDLTLIHPFFERHRDPGKHAKHFWIQLWFSFAVGALVLAHHFLERIYPAVASLEMKGQPTIFLPYVVGVLAVAANMALANHYRESDANVKRRAPGRAV